MKTKNLGLKIINEATKPAWELENDKREQAAKAEIIRSALELSFAHTDVQMMHRHKGDKVIYDPQKEEKLQELLSSHSIEMVEGENPALILIENCLEPLQDLIEKHGEDEELFDGRFMPKAIAIIKFYPKYAWLKANWMKFRKGKVALNECMQETKQAFAEAKVQGRFLWNIPA
ncbi:MAG: hypothetical protein RIG77_17875 [Cyclobacteriaceae bacterium]